MMLNLIQLRKHEYELEVELQLVRKLIELRIAKSPAAPKKQRVVKKRRKMSPEKRASFRVKMQEYHRKKREAKNEPVAS
jgi:hypothetical protein